MHTRCKQARLFGDDYIVAKPVSSFDEIELYLSSNLNADTHARPIFAGEVIT